MSLIDASKFVDKEVQTIIQKSCQGDIGCKAGEQDDTFYSLLEFTPFQDIQEGSIRTINLRHNRRRFYNSISTSKLWLRNCLFSDDDAVSEICLTLRDRVRQGIFRRLKTYNDGETQTNLHVKPHILENDEEVAMVSLEREVQTENS